MLCSLAVGGGLRGVVDMQDFFDSLIPLRRGLASWRLWSDEDKSEHDQDDQNEQDQRATTAAALLLNRNLIAHGKSFLLSQEPPWYTERVDLATDVHGESRVCFSGSTGSQQQEARQDLPPRIGCLSRTPGRAVDDQGKDGKHDKGGNSNFDNVRQIHSHRSPFSGAPIFLQIGARFICLCLQMFIQASTYSPE